LSPRLRTVAKYIVDHPADFGLDSIRVTARKSGVSTYTLVRMAKALGFAGFDELRDPFRHALVFSSERVENPEWLEDLRNTNEVGQVQAGVAANTMAVVRGSLERQTPEQMTRVVDLMLGARNIYLTAVRASYSMAYYFHYVGRMALPSLQLIPRHMSSAIDDLSDAGPDDVLIAITFTPYSRETIEACKFAQKRGVKLIMLADSDVISSEFTPEEILVVSVVSTHHFGCYSGVTAVLESLLALLVQAGGQSAESRIKTYENVRLENNAYWSVLKKH
jgi:DNA-binding MurR/RpiR family transcriptional regulator